MTQVRLEARSTQDLISGQRVQKLCGGSERTPPGTHTQSLVLEWVAESVGDAPNQDFPGM